MYNFYKNGFTYICIETFHAGQGCMKIGHGISLEESYKNLNDSPIEGHLEPIKGVEYILSESGDKVEEVKEVNISAAIVSEGWGGLVYGWGDNEWDAIDMAKDRINEEEVNMDFIGVVTINGEQLVKILNGTIKTEELDIDCDFDE